MIYIGFVLMAAGGLLFDAYAMIGATCFLVGIGLLYLSAARDDALNKEEQEKSSDPDYINMDARIYRDADLPVGMCAAKPEWYGRTAVVFMDNDGKPGQLMGYFVCMDSPSEYSSTGRDIDIYIPSVGSRQRLLRQQVLVLLSDGPGLAMSHRS